MIRFHQPAALFALLFALTPIIIYLVLRRRKTLRPWGAGYLLRLTLKSKRKSSRWKQILVLAIRTLVLALLACLLARPWVQNRKPDLSAPALPAGSLHRAILIDNSLSMSLRGRGGDGHAIGQPRPGADESRVARLKDALGALLRSQRSGDMVTLIPLIRTGDARPVVLRDKLSDASGRWRPAVTRTLAGLSLAEGKVPLNAGLVEAFTCLARTPNAVRELYIFSDFPRELSDQFDRLDWFEAMAKREKIRVVPVSMASGAVAGEAPVFSNVSVLDVQVGADVVLAGVPVNVYVEMENYGDQETLATLEFDIDGEPLRRRSVSLQANENKQITVPVTFTRPGISRLKISIDRSRLDVDTSVYYSVDVRKMPVVWVHTDEADPFSESKMTEAEFLLRALRQKTALGVPVKVSEVKLFDLTRPIPPHVDVILLAGPRVITPSAGRPLAEFVRRGGGLIVAMSPKADPSFYRDNLGQLLPAVPVKPVRESVDPETYFTVRQEIGPRASRLFEEFKGSESGELSDVRFYDYFSVKPHPGRARLRRARRPSPGAPEGDVVLRFTNDDPLLLHKRFGRGHVYLLTSSLGISWSSLGVRQSFVPFLYRLINAAMRGRVFARNLVPGRTFVTAWPAGADVKVTGPDAAPRPAEVVKGRQDTFAVVENLKMRGPYRLESAGGRTESFTVTGRFAEGDLRPLAAAQSRVLAGLLGSEIYHDWLSAVRAFAPTGGGSEIWTWVLLVLLMLYAVETWIVRTL